MTDEEIKKAKYQWLTEASATFTKAGFSDVIFREIPNEYCPPAAHCATCASRPWLRVITRNGQFKFGWRKRVLHLEWTDSFITETAERLFPEEDVTKYDWVIHAWSYEKAVEYLTKIRAADPILT